MKHETQCMIWRARVQSIICYLILTTIYASSYFHCNKVWVVIFLLSRSGVGDSLLAGPRPYSLLVCYFQFSTIYDGNTQAQTDYQGRETNVKQCKGVPSAGLDSQSVGGVFIIVGDKKYISPGAREVLIVTQFSRSPQFQWYLALF